MNWWPIISLVANLLLGLVIFSLKSTLRIAILELKEALAEKFATKEYVDERVALAQRIDSGFAKVHQLFDRGRGSQPGEGTLVR